MDRQTLKKVAVAMFDAIGTEHPLGHQPRKAARYVISYPGGTPLELMFEKNDVPANIWVHAEAARFLLGRGIESRKSEASDLWSVGPSGTVQYGRHSSLEKMPQLGNADLVCFQAESISQVGMNIDELILASARRISV